MGTVTISKEGLIVFVIYRNKEILLTKIIDGQELSLNFLFQIEKKCFLAKNYLKNK